MATTDVDDIMIVAHLLCPKKTHLRLCNLPNRQWRSSPPRTAHPGYHVETQVGGLMGLGERR